MGRCKSVSSRFFFFEKENLQLYNLNWKPNPLWLKGDLRNMLKFKMKSLFLYFPLHSFLDYPSCHAEQETPDLCKGTNLSEFTVTEGGSALVWRPFLRAVISWWLNQIRALWLCLLLADNLITNFLHSSLIAISLFLTFAPSTSLTLSYLFLLSSVTLALHFHFTFIVVHPQFLKWFCWTQRQCWENWTGRHILSMGWVKRSFLIIRIFKLNRSS